MVVFIQNHYLLKLKLRMKMTAKLTVPLAFVVKKTNCKVSWLDFFLPFYMPSNVLNFKKKKKQ